MRLLRRIGTAGAGLVITALVVAVAPAIANADTNVYSLNITPASVAGGSTTTFNLALQNSQQNGDGLHSATVTVPAQFTGVSASIPANSGNVSTSANAVTLTDLKLGAGGTLNISVKATVPSSCTTSTYSWGNTASEDEDNDGDDEGLALMNAGTAQQTSVSTPCGVIWGIEPQNATVNQTITGTAYSSTGPALTAEVVDQSGNVVKSSTAPITVAIGNNPGSSTLGGTKTVNAVNGVASFSNLSLNNPADGYTLTASSPGLQSGTSSSFNESSAGTECPQNQTCQTSVTTSASSFQVTASPDTSKTNSGFLEESVNEGKPLQCAGYSQEDPNTWQFFMSSINRSKSIHYVITNPILPPGVTTFAALFGQTQVCYAAPYDFTTSSGTQAPPGTLPDGSSGFIGLLPACPASGPCFSKTSQLDLTNGLNFDLVITINVPEGLAGDPWGRA